MGSADVTPKIEFRGSIGIIRGGKIMSHEASAGNINRERGVADG